jgi:hypothetical protein
MRLQWDIFGTLTFKGTAPAFSGALAAWFAWARTVDKLSQGRIKWRDLLALIRYEYGGLNGRPHLHVLLADTGCNVGLLHFLSYTWSGLRVESQMQLDGTKKDVHHFDRSDRSLAYGFADFRAFEGDSALAYLLKAQNSLEFSRFSSTSSAGDGGRCVYFTAALVKALAK